MKKITISGDRRVGKTSFLANSIINHLTDPRVKSEACLVASAPSQGMVRNLHNRIIEQLKLTGEKFSYDYNEIRVGDKKCRFVSPDPIYFIGLQIDYIFLDEATYFPKSFLDFIDTIMRPNVVVIQTHTTDPKSKEYLDGVVIT